MSVNKSEDMLRNVVKVIVSVGMGIFILWSIVWIFSGCAFNAPITSTIEDPEGQIWTILSKSDALVEIKRPDGVIVKVDNRGKPSFFETYMQYLLIKAAPSVDLSNQPGTKN